MSAERAPGAGRAPKAVVFGCRGTALAEEERRLFREADPLGFILFGRNVADAGQVRRLVDDLRGAVGRADAPVLVDQEGGRVQRLGPPAWAPRPAMRRFGERMRRDRGAALAAARLNAELIAADLRALGVTVNCAPVLDLALGHDVIGDRAFSDDAAVVAALGRAVYEGLARGGVVPVVKHLPGHGRAAADSHVELPRVDAPLDVLSGSDFVPFTALADAVAGMTAHVAYGALDGGRAASMSPEVIAGTIRGRIGFRGLLLSDDVCMAALSGAPGERVRAVIGAGCDVALHCNGDIDEMRDVAERCPAMDSGARARLGRALRACPPPAEGLDRAAAARRVEELLADGP